MRTKEVFVDDYRTAIKFLVHNDESFARELSRVRKKTSNIWFGCLLIAVYCGYKFAKLENQIVELHRELKKVNKQLDDQGDVLDEITIK